MALYPINYLIATINYHYNIPININKDVILAFNLSFNLINLTPYFQ